MAVIKDRKKKVLDPQAFLELNDRLAERIKPIGRLDGKFTNLGWIGSLGDGDFKFHALLRRLLAKEKNERARKKDTKLSGKRRTFEGQRKSFRWKKRERCAEKADVRELTKAVTLEPKPGVVVDRGGSFDHGEVRTLVVDLALRTRDRSLDLS